MSWFERDSFEQEILDDIVARRFAHKISWMDACSKVAQVLSHMCDSSYRDQMLADAKEEGRVVARQELLDKLK